MHEEYVVFRPVYFADKNKDNKRRGKIKKRIVTE